MNKLKEFLFKAFLLSMLAGAPIIMIYMGYQGLISGNPFEVVFGVILLLVGLYVPFNFLSGKRISGMIATVLSYSFVIALAILFAMIGLAVAIAPFTDIDLTIDVGIIVLRSGFVKFVLIVVDAVILYYLYQTAKELYLKKVKGK
jgi:hypothetical protein